MKEPILSKVFGTKFFEDEQNESKIIARKSSNPYVFVYFKTYNITVVNIILKLCFLLYLTD